MFVYFNFNDIIADKQNFSISPINNTPRKIHDIESYDNVPSRGRRRFTGGKVLASRGYRALNPIFTY